MAAEVEPLFDVAHLGHVELLTPNLDDSLEFFTTVFGLDLVQAKADVAYLRGPRDYDLTTLKLRHAERAGVGHVGWRTVSNAALARRVKALEETNADGSWIDGDVGHGPAYVFRAPSGHTLELYYESEKYRAPAALRSCMLNLPQKSITKGAGALRLDHINLLAQDVSVTSQHARQNLGLKLRERLITEDGTEVGAWLSLMNKAHDLALTKEVAACDGRLHHLAYAVECREDVIRAADVFSECGVQIEFGPAKHLRTLGFFLYVYEPGGNRIELFTGGLEIFAPDWETVDWIVEGGDKRSAAWGVQVPKSFHEYATPASGAGVGDEGKS